ncbi:MAG: Superoxide dismutase precursor [Labilithrix sp.]|nr:Superoxide dismutase precursor [Labilithrix sp.]
MKTRRFVMATFGVTAAIAAMLYGCSNDDKAAAPGAKGTDDSGGGGKGSSRADQQVALETGFDVTTWMTAHADIRPTSTGTVGDASILNGTATFTEANGGGVIVVVSLAQAFPPGGPGLRGIHIHENGSCNPSDGGADGALVGAGAAGPHWNPTDAGHGYPTAAVHHAGDMGNILITDAGSGQLTLMSKDWTVAPGSKSVVGHALVFHEQMDDGVSQPAGEAGARSGCGVIVAP